MRIPRTPAVTAVITLTAGLALAGCSSNPGGTTSGTTTSSANAAGAVDTTLAASLPPDVKKAGTITVAIDPTYAPFESIQGGKIVGLDADLAHAIGGVLNVKVAFKQTSFDAIIPALQAKDADMALSSIGDNKQREQVVDFVTAYWNGTLLLVKKGNPKKGTPELACGMTVGVIRGSLQQTQFLPAQNSKCTNKGQAAPVAAVFPNSQQGALALQSGRVDAVLADAPTVAQTAASEPSFEVAGPIMRNPDPAGIAFPKGSKLVEPVQGALNLLIKDGEYAKILKKYNLDSIAVQQSEINGALQ